MSPRKGYSIPPQTEALVRAVDDRRTPGVDAYMRLSAERGDCAPEPCHACGLYHAARSLCVAVDFAPQSDNCQRAPANGPYTGTATVRVLPSQEQLRKEARRAKAKA